MLNALYLTAEKLGVEILYDAEVTRSRDRGRHVPRRKAEAAGRRRDATSAPPTLVAAAGGFEANIEWLKEYWGEAADNFLIRGTPYNRGSILKMLLDKGVQEVGDPTQCHAVAIDARAPKFDGGIITRHDSVVFGIVVNKHAAALLRRGRGHLAETLRDLGPPGRGAARPDRLHHLRFQRRHELHADAVSADRGAPRSPSSPASSSSIRRRWKRPSPNSTPRCGPAPSITPSSTIAAPKG